MLPNKIWKPNKEVSEGASMYHAAVIEAGWYYDNLEKMNNMINDLVKENNVLVDFGAGTGISSWFLLKNMPTKVKLWLVDNSPSWLAKAYGIMQGIPDISFFLLEKKDSRYLTLAETIGNEVADIVFSANTFHLVPNLLETFQGVYASLKSGGAFILQSGNISRSGRQEGVLMIDDSVERVHDIAIGLIRSKKEYSRYLIGLDERLFLERGQRKMVFPDTRSIEKYVELLEKAGFIDVNVCYKSIKVKYDDWRKFLCVRRIQAGILPEIGGKNASPEEEQDREAVIKLAIEELFEEIRNKNPMATEDGFFAEWTYIKSKKPLHPKRSG